MGARAVGAYAADTKERAGIADVPALRAEVVELEGELEALAAAFDRWWDEVPEDTVADLHEGARLHHEIVSRLELVARHRDCLKV